MKTIRLKEFGWGSSIRSWWDHFSRHGRNVLRHMTVRRFANAVLLLCELMLRKKKLRSRPIVVKIEPTNVCNFKCPGCRTGSGEDTSPRGKIELEDFRRIVDQVHRHAFKLILYMWGEPLIHRDVFRMIEYAAGKNMAVQISSNMNVFRDSYAEQIVDSGLEHLIVALDGVTQETYEKYRVGGRVQAVIDNLTEVIRVRKEKKREFPIVEVQYIVLSHNRHEMEQARRLAEQIGVDRMTFIDSSSNSGTATKRPEDTKPPIPDKCNALWMMACFNWDGSLSPCCDSVDDSFGNALEEDFGRLWNSKKMQKSRSLFTSKPVEGGPVTKCSRCRIYGSHVTFLPQTKESSGSDAVAEFSGGRVTT